MTPSQHRDVYVWQLVQVFREYVDFPGHGAPHATHGLFGSLLAPVTGRGDPAAAAEWTQLTSTNNIISFVKITEHLYSIFARNIKKREWSLERGVYLSLHIYTWSGCM